VQVSFFKYTIPAVKTITLEALQRIVKMEATDPSWFNTWKYKKISDDNEFVVKDL
jgi:hypothetical protein